ncbi:hypothetical protein [Streptomyces minutiscleroticus]|uniref:Uncharacterized protein n=1 Tax=Streptomyces minutiscleroticus TaxID=68238 RepID=A0A918NJQ2_9ACTN|nr:hypothetical protein [Streptomyces minutiscleroticus]GGX73037.1 hypothetical protein GCM10010358_29270 [Streptomyces minutiscleroticus]
MEQSGTSTPLTGAVQDLASEVVSALRSGGHSRVVRGATGIDGDDGITVAAVRILGPDVLLPSILLRTTPDTEDVALFEKAVTGFPPPPNASPASVWSHWAMTQALRRANASGGAYADGVPAGGEEPRTTWLEDASWQFLTHQLAVLGGLATPDGTSAVARIAARRPVDVARGFVRAVRRRDWLQAAAAGRWLVTLDGVPETLGLDAGLDFVDLMGGGDPRVALHLQAARLMRAGERG